MEQSIVIVFTHVSLFSFFYIFCLAPVLRDSHQSVAKEVTWTGQELLNNSQLFFLACTGVWVFTFHYHRLSRTLLLPTEARLDHCCAVADNYLESSLGSFTALETACHTSLPLIVLHPYQASCHTSLPLSVLHPYQAFCLTSLPLIVLHLSLIHI